MKLFRPLRIIVLAPGLAALLSAAAQAADKSSSTLSFSDPSQPGTVRIQLARGDLRIQGSDTEKVTVVSEAQPVASRRRDDGLRVLTASTGFALTEKGNVITLDAFSDGWSGSAADFKVTVPRDTDIIVQSSFGGDIRCSDIAGDIEINSMNGEIRLENVAGGVVVGTHNGEIEASIAELHERRPLSFTSMNGEVLLRVPADAKANVRLRTQNGSVLTDFPESALVTRTEATAYMSMRESPDGVLPPEAREAIHEAARIGAEAMREAAAAMREAAAAAREGAQAARERRSEPGANGKPNPARPPPPPIPTITGGKLVTGTLNGGGPEISVATLNGDVILRQLDGKE